MLKGFFNVPVPVNEPIRSYAPGSAEKRELKAMLTHLSSQKMDIPMVIGGQEIQSENKKAIRIPHDHEHILGYYHEADAGHVEQAIQASLGAKEEWESLTWEQRAAIFLKIADLLAGPYRAKINAATMLSQSKNVFQAEIDSACETIDFFRFNAYYMTQLYAEQPDSSPVNWNRMEYRPLEGFIFAVTPFNFTSIASNLPTAPALMGNTIVWKPSPKQIYSAWVLMEVFREAGLPDGVINMIYDDGPLSSEIIFKHSDFGGVHFTGSTRVFKHFWRTIGENMDIYKGYPRIVGETGGKDFIIAHKSARPKEVATAIIRGAFEFQGQKCSAASRAYIPNNLWEEIKGYLLEDIGRIKMGDASDFTNFMNAVIDEYAFDKITAYIERARKSQLVEILAGGNHDKTKGYFIEPTILVTQDPEYETMKEEIFGPVMTIYIYHQDHFDEVLYLVDHTSPYALTGAIFAQDRYAIDLATKTLRNAAGNFYINDKPTGAVVGQQPFGGARASGTNDKAGSLLNLLRWASPRAIKENFNPPTDFTYPFMGEA
jgi:1-pyrroline-5-carboxylate dehydrogenase